MNPIGYIPPQRLSDFDDDLPSENPFLPESPPHKPIPQPIEEVLLTGLSNAVTLPISLIGYVKSLIQAIRERDIEGIIEYTIKIFTVPFGVSNALEDVTIVGQIFFRVIELSLLTITSTAFAIVFLVLEGLLELMRFMRVLDFRDSINLNKLQSALKTCNNQVIEQDKIDLIEATLNQIEQQFLTTSETNPKAKAAILKGKKNVLARRIQPSFAMKLETQIAAWKTELLFLNKILSNDEVSTKEKLSAASVVVLDGKELINKIDEQSNKILFVHVLGLITIVLGILSFGAGAALFPPIFGVIGLTILIMCTQTARSYAQQSFLNHDGYSWHFFDMLPEFIRSFFETSDRDLTYKPMQSINKGKRRIGTLVGAINEPAKHPSWTRHLPFMN